MSVQSQRANPWDWLRDDAEEDLVGADWHQHAIGALYASLVDVSTTYDWPWQVGNQLSLVAWKPDGTRWCPSPDIMVHPHAGPDLRDEMSVRLDGPPALVVEVVSASTWAYDADTVAGKGAGYLGLGIPAYLVFDPTTRLLGAPIMGWHLADAQVEEWKVDADGRYHSEALNISFRPDGNVLRVFDPDWQPVRYREELLRDTMAQAHQIAELRAELARLRGEES